MTNPYSPNFVLVNPAPGAINCEQPETPANSSPFADLFKLLEKDNPSPADLTHLLRRVAGEEALA